MEIHDEGILSDFLFGMKKGACAPFSCEINIAVNYLAITYAAAAFFLPITLPMSGQKSNNNARDVIPPTK